MHSGVFMRLHAFYPFKPGDAKRDEEAWSVLGDFQPDFIRASTFEPLGIRLAKFEIATRDALKAANALRDAGFRHYMVFSP